jgi:hypothetical protein
MNALTIDYHGLGAADEEELRRHEPCIQQAAGGRADLEFIWRADGRPGRRGLKLVVRRRGHDWPPPSRCLRIPEERLGGLAPADLAHGVGDAVSGLP